MTNANRLAIAALAVLLCGNAEAEPVKIGMQKVAGPIYIAVERGYFAAAGLEPEIVYFEAGQPVAVAAVSGDIDFGIAGLTGGLYALAEQGALKIIAGQTREAPGFHANTVVASNKAYAAGLTALKDLGGHSVAVTQIGSAFHYDLALLSAKYGFDLKTVRIVPLQTNPNAVAAVSGGTVDAAISVYPYLAPAIERGDAKLLGFIGDVTPWQLAAAFTSARTADTRGSLVTKFLNAFRKATRDYHDAFTGADGRRKDGPTAPAILAILAKDTGRPVAEIDDGIGYVDRDARIDVADIARQVAWYQEQKLVKGDIPGDQAHRHALRAAAQPLQSRRIEEIERALPSQRGRRLVVARGIGVVVEGVVGAVVEIGGVAHPRFLQRLLVGGPRRIHAVVEPGIVQHQRGLDVRHLVERRRHAVIRHHGGEVGRGFGQEIRRCRRPSRNRPRRSCR